jgi:hypothetical protein
LLGKLEEMPQSAAKPHQNSAKEIRDATGSTAKPHQDDQV